MSIGDTIFIFFLALIFFGPKKLPELARQLGKLVAEFRRASNEFKFQMEEELRMAEQADNQKKFAAMQSVPADETPQAIATSGELSIMPPSTGLPVSASSSDADEASSTASPYDSGSDWASESTAASFPAPPDRHTQATAEMSAMLRPDVVHQPSTLSALLGPPSQADAQPAAAENTPAAAPAEAATLVGEPVYTPALNEVHPGHE